MIIVVDNPILLPQIYSLGRLVENVSETAFKEMLCKGIGDDNTFIVCDKKDNEVRGFMLASIESFDGFDGKDVAFIHLSYVKPTAVNVCSELLTRVRQWGGSKGVDEVYIMSPRDPRPFMRKYKFKFVTHVLKRRV